MCKKKKTSPQKAVKRLKAILFIIAVILLFLFVSRKGNNSDSSECTTPQEMLLNEKLDSLITEVAPQGYHLIRVGKPKVIWREIENPYSNKIRNIETRLSALSAQMENPTEELVRTINALNYELAQYRAQVEKDKDNPKLKMAIDTRRVRFETTDGREYLCSQQHFKGNHKLKYLTELEENINNKTE